LKVKERFLRTTRCIIGQNNHTYQQAFFSRIGIEGKKTEERKTEIYSVSEKGMPL
jgi:hypothetical protein